MSDKILRLPEVLNRIGLRRSTIYELMDQGNFPRQVHLGVRSVGWLESEIEVWLSSRVARSKSKFSISHDSTNGGDQ